MHKCIIVVKKYEGSSLKDFRVIVSLNKNAFMLYTTDKTKNLY